MDATISRKHGLSKSGLGGASSDGGIVYEHRRESGNPKVNRVGFAGARAEWADARTQCSVLMRRPEAFQSLEGAGPSRHPASRHHQAHTTGDGAEPASHQNDLALPICSQCKEQKANGSLPKIR